MKDNVCGTLTMCKKREEFVRAWPDIAKAVKPNFCPFCGKKWYDTADDTQQSC